MFEDVRHPRRSLRDVLPPRSLSSARAAKTEVVVEAPPPRRRSRFGFGLLLVIILLVVVGAIVFFVGNAFAKVSFSVTPKTATMIFDHTPVTYGPLQVMTLKPVIDSRIVPSSGSTKVEQSATGNIVVYNAFNSSPQSLIKGTRFQAVSGKIYRSAKAVTVPGAITKNGTTTPGSVSVDVLADAPGADYNTGPTTFTIPGFKGDPRYTKFYGQSTTGLSGGASGLVPNVSPEALTQVHNDLRQTLTTRALGEARAQIPDTFVVYDGASFLSFADKIEPVVGSSTAAKISTTATLKVLLFDRGNLTQKLGAVEATALSNIPFTLPHLDELSVQLPNKDKLNLTTDKSVSLGITGTSTAVASVDASALSAALAGKPVSQAQTIFGQFPGIQGAQIKLTPPWLTKFPQDPAQNHIILLTPQ